jgi:hypothetical protein
MIGIGSIEKEKVWGHEGPEMEKVFGKISLREYRSG